MKYDKEEWNVNCIYRLIVSVTGIGIHARCSMRIKKDPITNNVIIVKKKNAKDRLTIRLTMGKLFVLSLNV